MSNKALAIIADNTGVSAEEVSTVLKGMIVSAKKQHGAIATDAEMAVVSGVCAKYDLNPLVKECAAFLSGGKLGIVVMIDGWYRIVNRQPDFDGVEFKDAFSDEGKLIETECKMHLKNRSYPVCVTEYLAECKDPKSSVWSKWPARMLRHKAYIQAARMAFGFSEMIDDDEAARITSNQPERDVTPAKEPEMPEVDLESINHAMSQCNNLDQLREVSTGIKAGLERAKQWEQVKAEVVAMNKKHGERIQAEAEVIDVEFEPEERAQEGAQMNKDDFDEWFKRNWPRG